MRDAILRSGQLHPELRREKRPFACWQRRRKRTDFGDVQRRLNNGAAVCRSVSYHGSSRGLSTPRLRHLGLVLLLLLRSPVGASGLRGRSGRSRGRLLVSLLLLLLVRIGGRVGGTYQRVHSSSALQGRQVLQPVVRPGGGAGGGRSGPVRGVHGGGCRGGRLLMRRLVREPVEGGRQGRVADHVLRGHQACHAGRKIRDVHLA